MSAGLSFRGFHTNGKSMAARTYEEVASLLCLNVRTVKKIELRARRKLAKELVSVESARGKESAHA